MRLSILIVTVPASCPWVTAVGGTSGTNPERAASLSSGGFSNYYSAPDYQSNKTAAYVQGLGSKYNGYYNPKGRGIPDVSAQAESYVIVINNFNSYVSGTSCSAPVFASIIALLNDYRVANGNSPLGFLNPFLYGKGAAGLVDVTSGNNPGCQTNGFSATRGWDPVTGMGTPNFGTLKTLV